MPTAGDSGQSPHRILAVPTIRCVAELGEHRIRHGVGVDELHEESQHAHRIDPADAESHHQAREYELRAALPISVDGRIVVAAVNRGVMEAEFAARARTFLPDRWLLVM